MVLSKEVTLFSYESYAGIMLMKNSFLLSWQDAKMIGCKTKPFKMALCVFEPTSDFEVTQQHVTNLPVLLGVIFFQWGLLNLILQASDIIHAS